MTPEIKSVIEESAEKYVKEQRTENEAGCMVDFIQGAKEVIENSEKYGLVTQDKYDRLYEELKKWT